MRERDKEKEHKLSKLAIQCVIKDYAAAHFKHYFYPISINIFKSVYARIYILYTSCCVFLLNTVYKYNFHFFFRIVTIKYVYGTTYCSAFSFWRVFLMVFFFVFCFFLAFYFWTNVFQHFGYKLK